MIHQRIFFIVKNLEKLNEENFIENQFSGKRRLTADEIDVTIKYVNGRKPQQGKRKSVCERKAEK